MSDTSEELLRLVRKDLERLEGKIDEQEKILTNHRISYAALVGKLGAIGALAAMVFSALFSWIGSVFF